MESSGIKFVLKLEESKLTACWEPCYCPNVRGSIISHLTVRRVHNFGEQFPKLSEVSEPNW